MALLKGKVLGVTLLGIIKVESFWGSLYLALLKGKVLGVTILDIIKGEKCQHFGLRQVGGKCAEFGALSKRS